MHHMLQRIATHDKTRFNILINSSKSSNHVQFKYKEAIIGESFKSQKKIKDFVYHHKVFLPFNAQLKV